MFRLIDISIDIKKNSINWKDYFDRSILVISMTVLQFLEESFNPFNAKATIIQSTRMERLL